MTENANTSTAATVAARPPSIPSTPSSVLDQAAKMLKGISERIDGPEHRIDTTAREIFVRLVARDWSENSAAACAYDAAALARREVRKALK